MVTWSDKSIELQSEARELVERLPESVRQRGLRYARSVGTLADIARNGGLTPVLFAAVLRDLREEARTIAQSKRSVVLT